MNEATLHACSMQQQQQQQLGFPGGSEGKESACNTGNPDSIHGLGRSLGEGNSYSL